MKKVMIIAALLALAAVYAVIHTLTASSVVPRPLRLVITGGDGQRFSGSYVADGVTNSVSAIAPAVVTFQARNVSYEFMRESGDGEFRVALFVGELCRTSATSDHRNGVRGALRYADRQESYWAGGF